MTYLQTVYKKARASSNVQDASDRLFCREAEADCLSTILHELLSLVDNYYTCPRIDLLTEACRLANCYCLCADEQDQKSATFGVYKIAETGKHALAYHIRSGNAALGNLFYLDTDGAKFEGTFVASKLIAELEAQISVARKSASEFNLELRKAKRVLARYDKLLRQ